MRNIPFSVGVVTMPHDSRHRLYTLYEYDVLSLESLRVKEESQSFVRENAKIDRYEFAKDRRPSGRRHWS